MAIEEYRFPDNATAAYALAEELAAALREALVSRGYASLAVSGGRTPRLVFERLREEELDWKKVTVTLIDERWVPADHPDSNEGLARTYLLQGAASAATFVPLYGGEETPQAGQAACEKRLAEVPVPFDAVYLGMGEDGHFASLFPGDPAVAITTGRCIAVAASGGRVARMSLTAPAVLNARRVCLLFAGSEKHAKYSAARQPGPASELPVRLVMQQEQTPVKVFVAP